MGYDVTEVQKALKGVDYPAGPEDLAEAAQANGGPSGLADSLRNLDKDSFDGPSAVMEAMQGQLGRS
jgi:hypothetical protein